MIIDDKILGPYRILIDENNFQLQKRWIDRGGKTQYRTEGYFSTLKNALKKIAYNIQRKGNKQYTLIEYIEALTDINKKLLFHLEAVVASNFIEYKERKYKSKTKK